MLFILPYRLLYITRAYHTDLIEGDSEIDRTLLQKVWEKSVVEVEIDTKDSHSAIMAEPSITLFMYERP